MNIYFFIKDITLTGGTEKVTVSLSDLFLEKGHNVTIVSYFHGKNNLTYKPQKGVKVNFLVDGRCPDQGKWFVRFVLFLKCVKLLRKFFSSNKFGERDIIISQNLFSNVLIWLVGMSKYSVACEHFKYELYPKIIRGVRCLIYSTFKKVITLTDKDNVKFARHLGVQNVKTIPNMVVPIDGISPNHESKEMLAVGRLDPQKGFDMLIDAMVSVHQFHPDWRLNIFGEGQCRDMLQSQIERNYLKGVVNLRGYTNNLSGEFGKNAFFVLSSRFEGFPLVLIEALGQGMPIVSFDCPEGPSVLLESGGGILVERENVSKLAEAICYMIEHPEYRKECENHKEYIKTQLSQNQIYERWKHFVLEC